MRFFTFVATTASLLSTIVSAQNALAIISPGAGAVIQAGTTTTITWTPDDSAEVVLTLRFGEANDLAPGTPIGTVANAGTVQWTVPLDLVSGTTYTIEIADANGGDNVNYSPFFSITGGTGVSAATSATPSSAASSAAATSAGSLTSGTTTKNPSATSTTAPVTLSTTKVKTTSTDSSKTSTAASASASAPSNDAMSMRSGSLAAVVGMGALVMLA